MNLETALTRLHDDLDVVEPFALRLLKRTQERLGSHISLADITIAIEVRDYPPNVYSLLSDMMKESVGF